MDAEQPKKMTKVHDKEPLRDLHGVRTLKAHPYAQSVFVSFSRFYVSAQGYKSLCLQRSISNQAPDLTGWSRLNSRFPALHTKISSDFSPH